MANIPEGTSIQVKGSGSAVHTIKNSGGVYSCSCPAWRNQSLPPDQRSCKHMVKEGLSNVGPAPTMAAEEPSPIKSVPPVLLAHSWDNAKDLTGWWISEKYDGVRAWWDGTTFVSRQGNPFRAPTWFTDALPRHPLDGELWQGRGRFQETVGIVRKGTPVDKEWWDVKYMAFDHPTLDQGFEDRMLALGDLLRGKGSHLVPVTHNLCRGFDHLRAELARVTAEGAEGLMVREPGSRYEEGRSNTLFKLKVFHDAEATVKGYEAGKGKNKGRVGSLLAVSDTGIEFGIGTGLSDYQRENPPPIGARVTYRYQELTPAGVPRFPSFVAVRNYE